MAKKKTDQKVVLYAELNFTHDLILLRYANRLYLRKEKYRNNKSRGTNRIRLFLKEVTVDSKEHKEWKALSRSQGHKRRNQKVKLFYLNSAGYADQTISFVSKKAAAEYLGVSTKTLRGYMASGLFYKDEMPMRLRVEDIEDDKLYGSYSSNR